MCVYEGLSGLEVSKPVGNKQRREAVSVVVEDPP